MLAYLVMFLLLFYWTRIYLTVIVTRRRPNVIKLSSTVKKWYTAKNVQAATSLLTLCNRRDQQADKKLSTNLLQVDCQNLLSTG